MWDTLITYATSRERIRFHFILSRRINLFIENNAFYNTIYADNFFFQLTASFSAFDISLLKR